MKNFKLRSLAAISQLQKDYCSNKHNDANQLSQQVTVYIIRVFKSVGGQMVHPPGWRGSVRVKQGH